MLRPSSILWVLAVLCIAAAPLRAEDLVLEIPEGGIYAGVPFVMRVVINDDDAPQARPFPEVDGLTATGPPTTRTSRSTTIINGRMTQRTTTYFTYELVAQAPGFITIPAMRFDMARGERRTAPRTVMVSRLDGGDIIDVAITSDRSRYYVGEPVELWLEIAIRRFDDDRFAYIATAENTFQWIDLQGSRFGVFDSADRRSPPPTEWSEIERPDAEGRMVPWYLFRRVHIERPTAPGALEIEPVAVLVRFPVRLARRNDMLGRGTLQIVEEHLALGRASAPPIEVLAPPVAGRPGTFRGAVGAFSVVADAQPREVSVGDPVTLSLRIRDETSAGVRLDLLAPPPLDQLPQLTQRFRMPSDPLAGVVEESVKIFTQTIRPLDDTVTEVPPIPFTYFDPKLERYVTIETAPIPLSVAPVDRLSLDEVSAAPAGAPRRAQRAAPGLRHPLRDPDDLLRTPAIARGRTAIVLIGAAAALPPLCACAVLMVRRRRAGAHAQRMAVRRSALREALALCERDDAADGAHRGAERIGEAVAGFTGVLSGRPPGSTTGEEAVRALENAQLCEDLVREAADLIRAGERARYGGAASPADDSALRSRAQAVLQRLDQEWRS